MFTVRTAARVRTNKDCFSDFSVGEPSRKCLTGVPNNQTAAPYYCHFCDDLGLEERNRPTNKIYFHNKIIGTALILVIIYGAGIFLPAK